MNTPKLGLSALAVISILFSAPAFAVAGKFQFVNGEVQVLDASGKARAVKKGDAIDQGETVSSGTNGFAQIRMEDGGFFAVRPETEFKIDTFKYEGKEDGSEKGIFSLVKGSLRSVTGVVGKKNKDNYKINTATATIGIRGSGADVGHSSSLGTAVRTLFGGHSLTSAGRTIYTAPGQTAMAPPGEQPKYVYSFPFNTSTTSNQGGDGGGDNAGGSGNNNNGANNNASGNSNNDKVIIPIVDKDGTVNLTDLTQNGSKIGDSVAGPEGSGGSVAFFYLDDNELFVDQGFDIVGTESSEFGTYKFSSVVNADGALTAVKSEYFDEDGNGSVYGQVLGSATVTVEGRDTAMGVVWGRWSVGFTNTFAEVQNGVIVHAESETSPYGSVFVTGSHITTQAELSGFASWTGPGMQFDNPMPGVISGTYSLAPGNFPTLVNGVVSGSVTSALATANFTNQVLAVNIAGSGGGFGTWQVSGLQGFGGNGSHDMYINGSCSGGSGACGGMGTMIGGYAKGGFVGTQAQGLISTIGVTAGSNDALGAAVYLQRGAVANPLPVPFEP